MRIPLGTILTSSIIVLSSLTSVAQSDWTENINRLKNLLSTQAGDTNKVHSLLKLSEVYRFQHPDSALAYAQEALALAEKLESDNFKFWSIVAVSSSLYVLGNYPLQLDYALKAQPLGKKLNTPTTLGFSNGMLSDCYYNLGEYDTSLKYWRNVIDICKRTLPDELYAIYGNTSRIFSGMGRYDSALIYARKTYALLLRRNSAFDPLGEKFDQSNTFTVLGDAFAGSQKYDSALMFYRSALSASGDVKMEMNKLSDLIGIANIYHNLGSFDSAVWYAKKALSQHITAMYPIGKLKAATLLVNMYESKNYADSALKYMHLTLDIKNKLFSRERTIAFENSLSKEREKQKDLETATLKLQSEYRSYTMFGLLGLSVIVAGIIIRNKRVKQLQHIRNSIADDLHDDIGSVLSSISIMSELAKHRAPEALPLLVSIGESTSAIQENMSDIVWTIKAGNDRFDNVLVRMNQFASEIFDSKGIELDFFSDPSLEVCKLSMEQRKNFYLFFKEAINNAAKHSGARQVVVRISFKSHQVALVISDDGMGFNTSNISQGNGLSSLRKRATDLRGDFDITSFVDVGTIVKLRFKGA